MDLKELFYIVGVLTLAEKNVGVQADNILLTGIKNTRALIDKEVTLKTMDPRK